MAGGCLKKWLQDCLFRQQNPVTSTRCLGKVGPTGEGLKVMSEIVTAGILVIGDEILSGRTKDKNIGFIAEYLTNIGIDLKEVRVVADDEADIIAALDALRHRYDLCLHHRRHRPDP